MPSSEETPTVMLVDDEEIALASLRGLFTLETDYEILAFDNPVEALEETRRRPVDLVICDYLMPQMTGIETLKKMREIQPDMVRVLLTGFADKENTIRAINELDLFQYLEKPWDNQQLLLVVERGLQQRSLRRQLLEKIEELDRLLEEHRDLAERHSALERELEMAARVQRSLLPESMPEFNGLRFTGFYQPCHEIGGDYYGICARDDQATLLVADVSGHGIQAALTSMLMKAIFEEVERNAEAPADLVERMNEALHRFLPSGMYACGTLARMDAEPGRIRLVNAGLPHPFVLRARERRLDQIPIAGMPLGIFGPGGPASFDSTEIELAPGDVLLLTSDGIGDVQRAGAPDELFQDRRMKEVLESLAGRSGEEVIEKLISEAREFSGGGPIPDDISMVAVTRA